MRRTALSALLGGALAASLAVAPTAPAIAAVPPRNADFANATAIRPEGGTVAGDNSEATPQRDDSDSLPDEPDHGNSGWGALHSVWWSWTATKDGDVTVSTCGSGFDTRLGVYTGTAVNALTTRASNNDGGDPSCTAPNATKFAGATFAAVAGTTYYIAVDTNGDLNGDGTGAARGPIKLTLTPPATNEPPPPPPDDDTNPGTQMTEQPYEVTVPRFKPVCNEAKSGSTLDCPRKATNLYFWSVEKHQTWEKRNAVMRKWVDTQRAKGADITFVALPKPSAVMDGAIMKHLRSKGVGGEVLTQNVDPGTKIMTTTDDPLLLKVGYFDPAEDQKILDAALAALEKAGKDRKDVKSPCAFIDSNASPDMIETKLAEALGAGTLTQKRAGEILAEFGCGYEVTTPDGKPAYVDGPGFTTDVVLDVLGVDKKRALIHLKVALPVSQDFAFVISDDPGSGPADATSPQLSTLGLGLDGKLTASADQLNRLAVQVVERTTGRLVSGAQVEFYDAQGKPTTQTTNASGTTEFLSSFERPGRYALKATFVGANGARMVGFRSIDVIDRNQTTFFTMAGLPMSWNGASYETTVADLQLARDLPILTANLGTGLTGEPTAPPDIRQIQASIPTQDGFITGQHNAVYLPNNTNYLVGSETGLITIGSGYDTQVASRGAMLQRRWGIDFQQAADWLVDLVLGIGEAMDSGEGTVAERFGSEEQDIATTADILLENGAKPSASTLISDKGLGLIGQAGGNVIATDGATVISTGGGNCISVGGGNRAGHQRAPVGLHIGEENVLSMEKDMMPVYGGNVIATE